VPYDAASGLALHPTVSLYSYLAERNLVKYIVFNSAEYPGGRINGYPKFTYDGDELYYISCDIDCYIGVNGKNNLLNTNMEVGMDIAIAPGTQTYSYATSSTLVVAKFDSKGLTAGMMVDYTISPRYNRFEKRYETLGVINNKLYLMTCRPR
jgi:hypothetical protein